MRRRIGDPRFANSLWLIGDRVFRMGAGLVVTVLVARHLGPHSFGQLSLALTVLVFATFSSTLGMDQIVVRDLANRPADSRAVLGTAFALRIASGSIGYMLMLLVVWGLRPWDTITHILVSILGFGLVVQAADTFDLWFQSRVKARSTVAAKGVAFLIASVWRITLVVAGADVYWFAAAGLVELVLSACILTWVFFRDRDRNFGLQPSLHVARNLVAESWPVCLASLAVVVYAKADQFILASLAGIEAVGTYGAAARIAEAWYIIPVAVVSSVAPGLARLRGVSRERYEWQIFQVMRMLVLTAYAVALPIALFSDQLVTFLYGDKFHAAGSVLAIQVWTAVFVFLGVAQGPWTVNEGLAKFALIRSVAGVVASVALNFLLVPTMGIKGTAISALCAQAISTTLVNFALPATRRLFVLQVRALLLFVPRPS